MENKVRCKKYAVYSNQNCITTLLVEMIRGEMAEILLDNILRLFSTETFGKDKSAYYVGGAKKLMNLIDSIEVSNKEFIAAFVLVTVVSVNYICFRYYEDRKQNKDSL